MARGYYLFAVGGLLLVQGSASQGASADLQGQFNSTGVLSVPCAPENLKTPSHLRACAEVIAQFTSDLDKGVKTQADHMYSTGQSVDPSSGLEASAGNSYRFVKPACNVTGNVLSDGREERLTNHAGESCGEPVWLQVSIDSNAIATVTWDITGTRGSREAAYFGGTYLQAMGCYAAQVKKEITDTRSLRISPSCRSLAFDVYKAGMNSEAVATALRGQLANQANLGDIWNCKNTWAAAGDAAATDVGQLRQSAQQLCTARAGIESGFNQLMVCETFARAGKDFRSIYNDLDAFYLAVRNGPGKECRAVCRQQCGGCNSTGGCSACATQCANTCYPEHLMNFIKDKQKRWPADGSCPQAATGRSDRRRFA